MLTPQRVIIEPTSRRTPRSEHQTFVVVVVSVMAAFGLGSGCIEGPVDRLVEPEADVDEGPTPEPQPTANIDGGVDAPEPEDAPPARPSDRIVPPLGHGFEYGGTAEAGVVCMGEVCAEDEYCSHRVVNSGCWPDSDFNANEYGAVDCDGPEDCGDGLECRLHAHQQGAYRSSSCEAPESVTPQGQRVCNVDADCEGNDGCVPGWRDLGGVDRGVCQSGPTTGCETVPGVACAGADLSTTRLWTTDLHGADLREVDFRESFMSRVNLDGADLSASNLADATFKNNSLINANLRGASVVNSGFGGSNLTGADLRDIEGAGANFSGANLADANFRLAYIPGAGLECRLAGANFAFASLPDSYMPYAVADGASFLNATLTGLASWGTSFIGADLDGADLREAWIRDADFTDATFSGANLEGALFQNVICPDGTISDDGDNALCGLDTL